MIRIFPKLCSFGSSSSDNGEEYEYGTEEPSILQGSRVQLQSEELVRELSSLQLPHVAVRNEATVNLSALRASERSVLPFAGRVKSISRQRPEGAAGLEWTESRKILEAAIAIEQQSIPADLGLHYRQDVEAQELRLLRRLHQLGLDMDVQRGDGNCQFRSISFCLYGTPAHHGRVRQRAVEYMKLHRAEFEAFLGEEFKAYVREMGRDGVWGDELTLRAVCEAYGVVINVVSSDSDNWFMRYLPNHTLVRCEVFLSYIAPIHYNAVRRRPRGAGSTLRSLSSLGRRNSRILGALDEYAARRAVPENPQVLVEAAAGADARSA